MSTYVLTEVHVVLLWLFLGLSVGVVLVFLLPDALNQIGKGSWTAHTIESGAASLIPQLLLSDSFTTASQILIVRLIVCSVCLLYEDGILRIHASTAVKAKSFLAEIGLRRLLSHLDESTSQGMIAAAL